MLHSLFRFTLLVFLVSASLLTVDPAFGRSGDPGSPLLAKAMWADHAGLRAAITDAHTRGDEVTARGTRFLARFDAIVGKIPGGGETGDALAPSAPSDEILLQLRTLLREAIVADGEALDFDKILFVSRFKYSSNHYYTDYVNSRFMPGGSLCVLDLKTGAVTEIVKELKGGVFGRYDLSFDAERIVFSWKKSAAEGYRIYEVQVDGSGLRQLTFPEPDEAELVRNYRVSNQYHHGTDDMDPCYLPDGGVAFISTRCQYGILCDAPDNFTTTVLYRMDADGGNMVKLSNSSVSEAAPVLLSDGRLLYTRWEYVDKGAVSTKCLWAMWPDGSGSSEIYGNDVALPPTFIYGRPIPDHPNQFVVLGTPHYPQNAVGTVIRLDMNRNIRTREPMTYLTPLVDIRGEGGFHHRLRDDSDRWTRSNGGPLFKDPYPLSMKFFLVTLNEDQPYAHSTGWGLYLLHESGTVAKIHDDPGIGCFMPMPLRPRSRPPERPSVRDQRLAEKNLASCVVADVYRGLEDVPRGSIKHIRVLEQVPRPWASRRRWGGDAYDQQHVTITKDTHLGLKVQHGIVPVEADGSAHFVVPAGANIMLQALDENHMAVQTERTFVNYMPGETRSCIGCHETPGDAPPPLLDNGLQALMRPPSIPGPQVGEAAASRPLHYITDVQPVFDRHCVECHGGEKTEGNLNLSGRLTDLFCVSYENLVPSRRGGPFKHGRNLLGPVIGENHPKTGNISYLPARSLGSHTSILVAMLAPGKVVLDDPEAAKRAAELAENHKEIELDPAELLRITNWIDTNCQYYGSWWGRRNLRYEDHPNFRPVPTFPISRSMSSPVSEDQR